MSDIPRALPRARLVATLVATLAAAPAAAQTDYYNTDAGRPIVVEDAYPVEFRAVELQVAPLRLERARGAYTWGFEPEVAVGLLPRTQLEVGFPLLTADAGVAGRTSGLAGIELGVLHNLNVETAIPALGVAAEVLLPAGGLAPEETFASLKGILTRTFTWARFHANAQYTFGDAPDESPDAAVELHPSRWLAGLAVDRPFPLRSLLVTGELVAAQPLREDEDVAWSTAAGARFQLSPRIAIDGGAGYQLTGDDRGWFVTAGAAVALGLPWSR